MRSTLSPQAFVAKWRHTTLKERSAAQEHFVDLCRLAGHPTPAESDAHGERFTLEAGAGKQRGDRRVEGGLLRLGAFETFPFPWPSGGEPQDDPRLQTIAQAAHELVQKRDAWLNPPGAPQAELAWGTLTNLYSQRPTWLDLAHRRLDEAVLDAYGWPRDLGDEAILERLLALNVERAAAEDK